MSVPEERKQTRRRWPGPLAAAFAIAGSGFYSSSFPNHGNLSATRFLVACGVGAASALFGYAVGTLIDRARK